MYGGYMKEDFPPGTAVTVHMDDGCNYLGQVMFRHFGDPDRVMVAWIGDSPSSGHDIADWVEAWRCSSPQTGRPNSPGGGAGSGLQHRVDLLDQLQAQHIRARSELPLLTYELGTSVGGLDGDRR